MRKPYRYHVLPCAGSKCGAKHGERLKGLLKDQLPKDERKRLGIRVSTTSCQGYCELGPNVCVYPEGVVYHRVGKADIARIVEQHLRGGEPVEELMKTPPGLGTSGEDDEGE